MHIDGGRVLELHTFYPPRLSLPSKTATPKTPALGHAAGGRADAHQLSALPSTPTQTFGPLRDLIMAHSVREHLGQMAPFKKHASIRSAADHHGEAICPVAPRCSPPGAARTAEPNTAQCHGEAGRLPYGPDVMKVAETSHTSAECCRAKPSVMLGCTPRRLTGVSRSWASTISG